MKQAFRHWLHVESKNGQLTVGRDRTSVVLTMLVCLLIFLLVCAWPLASLLEHTIRSKSDALQWVGMCLAALLAMLCHAATYLNSWIFVFDRSRNFVTYNDAVVCPMEELRSIHYQGIMPRRLYLKLKGDTEIDIEKGISLGASLEEMEKAGQMIADYAGIPLIKPEF